MAFRQQAIDFPLSRIRQITVYVFNFFSAHGGNNERGDGGDIPSRPDNFPGAVSELEVRAGARQPVVEGGLQGYPDQRGGEF